MQQCSNFTLYELHSVVSKDRFLSTLPKTGFVVKRVVKNIRTIAKTLSETLILKNLNLIDSIS